MLTAHDKVNTKNTFEDQQSFFITIAENEKKPWPIGQGFLSGATHEVRTRDLNLGKVALYQLS